MPGNILSGTIAAIDNTPIPKDVEEYYLKARFAEKLVTRDLLDITGDDAQVDLGFAGLEYSVKTPRSFAEKIERVMSKNPEISRKECVQDLRDTLRYTRLCKAEDIANETDKMISRLKEKGYTFCTLNNYYMHPYIPTNYRGIHLNFISPQGNLIELQIHSPESFKAKQEGHELYEKIRSVSADTKFRFPKTVFWFVTIK